MTQPSAIKTGGKVFSGDLKTPLTDSPLNPPTIPLPSWDERLKATLGDLARPFNLYAVGGATAVAIVIGATKITTAEGGAIYIAAVSVITLGLFGVKGVEAIKTGGQARDVAIAEVQSKAESK